MTINAVKNNTMHFNKPTICLLCSPNFAILDSWLPVLHALRQKDNTLNIVVIIPFRSVVKQIDFDNILIELAEELRIKVFFPSPAGGWILAESFRDAKKKATSWFLPEYLGKLNNRLKRYYPEKSIKFLAFCINFLETTKPLSNSEVESFFQSVNAFLLCFFRHINGDNTNSQINPIQSEMNGKPMFSIRHGNGLYTKIGVKSMIKIGEGLAKAYLYSEVERVYYKKRFPLDDKNLLVVGVPRHDPLWIDTVLKKGGGVTCFEPGYIFLITRSANEVWLPQSQKIKALKQIKKLAFDEFKLKVVIKTHPHEQNKSLYNEIFGTKNYGINWVYSDLHPFLIGNKALFAVCFRSGVAMDMIATGVPIIELCDLSSLEKYANGELLTDEAENPFFSHHRYFKLVLAANNYNDLKRHVEDIIKNRSKVAAKLQSRYKEVYANIDKRNDRIADDIRRSLA